MQTLYTYAQSLRSLMGHAFKDDKHAKFFILQQMRCFAGIHYSRTHQAALLPAEPNAGTRCRRAEISCLTLLLMFALGSYQIFLTKDH